jgi:phosphatidylglycerol:prolipoprotein diacylglycerol transferase
MHPILFRIPVPNWNVPGIGPLHEAFTQGNIPIYSYGVMLGLSLVVGWYLTLWLADKDGLPKETMANCYVVTALAAIVGSRVLYVLTNMDEFNSFGDFFAFRRGGLVAYGGFLGGYLGSWGYLKLKKIPLMPWADVAVPSLASGLAITRIGCYLFGCDFGKPLGENAPAFLQKIGTFPHWAPGTVDRGDGAPAWIQHVNSGLISQDATHSLPVHPTQLYESLVGLALLALLLFQRKHQRFRGQIFMLFAFSYGFLRFLLEIVRDDAERGEFGPELGAHIMLPGSLALFAAAYAIGFANVIPNISMRRLTQVLSFVPALVAYLTLRPGSFVTASLIQLSTSQWVGLFTAVAVAVAFMVYWKAAEAHPAEAMALNLSAFHAEQAKLEGKTSRATEEEDETDDEEEAPKKKAKKKKAKKKVEVEAKFDDDGDEEQDDAKGSKEQVEAKFDEDEDDDSKDGDDDSKDGDDDSKDGDDDSKDGDDDSKDDDDDSEDDDDDAKKKDSK